MVVDFTPFVLTAKVKGRSTTISVHPVEFDRSNENDRGHVISHPLPLAFAVALKQLLLTRIESKTPILRRRNRRPPSIRELIREAERTIMHTFGQYAEAFMTGEANASITSAKHESVLIPSEEAIGRVALGVVQERFLSTLDLTRALRQRGFTPASSIDVVMNRYVRRSCIQRIAGVMAERYYPFDSLTTWRWRCMRCDSKRIRFVPCARCRFHQCPHCVTCESLGASTGCIPFYFHRFKPSTSPSNEKRTSISLNLPFQLSEYQKRAANNLIQSKRDALLWAACGAGKTETVLPIIRHVVSRGGKVLFALPRRDVATQIGERLTEVITGCDIVTLTGDTPHKYDAAPVIVSTVHQSLRFRNAFDVVIVDEIDAFPLDREPWLLKALIRAKKPDGRVVMMTATPPPRLFDDSQKKTSIFTLPRRPHGHPLPVPNIVIDKRSSLTSLKKGRGRSNDKRPAWAETLLNIVFRSKRKKRRLLIFVPSVSLTETIADVVETNVKPTSNHRYTVDFVHARDANRVEKIRAMAKGKIDCLVSTSILERGVTLPFLDVIVMFAHSEGLFTAASLVQMAGRVGRSFDDPTGNVTFIGKRSTPAMEEAVDSIKWMNDIGPETSF